MDLRKSLPLVVASLLAVIHLQQVIAAEDPLPVVQTPNGQIEGTYDGVSRNGRKFYQFRGVQYANVQERFKPSVELQPWEGTKAAKEFALGCDGVRLHGEENCLFLNVYTPRLPKDDSKKLPVVVFIHGGFFKSGNSGNVGPNYLLDEEVVFVTINYRLGVLGFLSTGDENAPGNNGLKDQAMALKWVQKNIHAFGGDKDRVTVMGQSVGAASVTYHLLSPMSKGLFQGAIAQSGVFANPWALTKKPLQYAEKLATLVNCTDITSTKAIVECLKTIPAKQLGCGKLLKNASVKFFGVPLAFGPTIEPIVGDGSTTFLSENPFQLLSSGKVVNKVPLLTGFTKEEGIFTLAAPLLYSTKPNAISDRKNLEQNWTSVAPLAFYFDEIVSKEGQAEVSEKIKNFYFKSGFSLDNLDSLFTPLAQLYSDRFFLTQGIKFINLYSKLAQTFPYLYTFNKYRGIEFNQLNITGLDGKTLDATHGSDLDVLFSPLLNETRNAEDHNRLSVSIVKLFVSFINEGKPTGTYGSERNFPPVDATKGLQQFYRLDEDTKLIENIYSDRLAFWEGLKLRDFE